MEKKLPKIKIIEDKKIWNKNLNFFSFYDFYHTYDYHHIAKLENEKPILLKYKEGETLIVIPFLLRKIFNTDYYDLTSVYGYSGPLFKNIDYNFCINNFETQLNSFCEENKFVSIFSRLHPFIENQTKVLGNIGEVIPLGKVVNVDLTKNLEEQRAYFSKTTKRYLNKTSKLCIVNKTVTNDNLEVFKDLYYENMDRVNAAQSYYFSSDYFSQFVNSTDFETEILFAQLKETNEVISAAMMIKTNNIIQYHISGTRDNYLNLTPIRLLIDTMRVIGTEEGYQFFNLGGGLGSSEDSLFKFKASFSKDFKTFKIWKHIVNQKVYKLLADRFSESDLNQDFFPLYRNNFDLLKT